MMFMTTYFEKTSTLNIVLVLLNVEKGKYVLHLGLVITVSRYQFDGKCVWSLMKLKLMYRKNTWQFILNLKPI